MKAEPTMGLPLCVEYVSAAALAERDATIAALRAENDQLAGYLRDRDDQAEQLRGDRDAAQRARDRARQDAARLRAGITALAEAGPERRSGPGPRLCYHGRSLNEDCSSCYSEALIALLDPQAPDAGEGRA
jgi:hypothetical protein